MKSAIKRMVPKPLRNAAWRFLDGFPNPYTFRPRRFALSVVYAKRKWMGELEIEMHPYFLEKWVRPDKVALDIGANIGCYSYALSKICRNVEAFEPNPLVAEVLQSHGAHNIRVHIVGLSSSEGFAELHIPIVNGIPRYGCGSLSQVFGASEERFTVPVKRLDDFGFTDISFVKIDVEGHEAEVLKGGEATLRRWMPALLIEIEQRHMACPVTEVFSIPLGWGYKGFYLDEGQEHPISEFSVAQHQTPFSPTDPRYINNFLFRV
ncbi:MAG TPA: FkbM family methyltransferase [Armatimonadota bacterium]|jgi:FkbM family methyltransferase